MYLISISEQSNKGNVEEDFPSMAGVSGPHIGNNCF